MKVADIPVGKLTRDQVPKPPRGAARDYGGDPPYPNRGYVIDLELDEGHSVRWRFDNRGLVAFIVYAPSNEWRSTWAKGARRR
jgi:hypothetical protein